MKLCEYITKRRKELGFSQNKFAKSIGITQSYYNSIERDEVKNPPSEEVLGKICQGLELKDSERERVLYLAAYERTPKLILDKMRNLEVEKNEAISSARLSITGNMVTFPLYERISAGVGVDVGGDECDYISLPHIKNPENIFGVNVWGDSMEPTIKNHSIIICRRNTEVRDGEVGAFIIENEAYVKRLKVTKSHIALMSDNPNYPPIYIDPSEELKVVGKVIKVLTDI